jgi:uncharacterized protein (DUF305 family)
VSHPTGDPSGDLDNGVATLSWWRSRLNLTVVALAIAVLFAGGGYVVGNNRALPDPNAVDIGFLQDMRYQHEQAVQISLLYINTLGSDPDTIFVTLMTAHHHGGIHMAEYAIAHAGTPEVQLMAEQMTGGQRDEIDELAQLLAATTT